MASRWAALSTQFAHFEAAAASLWQTRGAARQSGNVTDRTHTVAPIPAAAARSKLAPRHRHACFCALRRLASVTQMLVSNRGCAQVGSLLRRSVNCLTCLIEVCLLFAFVRSCLPFQHCRIGQLPRRHL